MIRLSDYVIDFFVKKGITDVFLVSGGGIMYLCDSVGSNKKIKYISNYHEQASATAAEAYSRKTNNFGVCLVTTGPGGTNAITGVAGAWFDSIPQFVISGQVKKELISDYKKLRQKGPQEINIIDMVKPITKYCKTVLQPQTIRYELEKAYFYMKNGRPGPVWIDIPLDVQSAIIDETKLRGFHEPKKKEMSQKEYGNIQTAIHLLQKSRRPVLILGNGVRLSHGEVILRECIKKIKAPILLPINGLDLVEETHPYLMGKFGPFGSRRGNFTLQNADLVISIGASLNVASIGFNTQDFSPHSKKIMVNVDSGELTKDVIHIDVPIRMDAKQFMEVFLAQSRRLNFTYDPAWSRACSHWKKKYPNISKDYWDDMTHVNSYVFFDKLSDAVTAKDVIVTGIGLDAVSLYQAFRVKKNQRAFVNKNFGQMGWSLPAVIGACAANKRKRTICVTGDGSLQVNVHELSTIRQYNMPVKIFVFNNGGYESIRYTQNNLFDGRLVGSDSKTGVSNPQFDSLARAYGLLYEKINNNAEIESKITKVLAVDGPVLCEININEKQRRLPRISSYRKPDGTLVSKPLEDMWPFLPESEVHENMSLFDHSKLV